MKTQYETREESPRAEIFLGERYRDTYFGLEIDGEVRLNFQSMYPGYVYERIVEALEEEGIREYKITNGVRLIRPNEVKFYPGVKKFKVDPICPVTYADLVYTLESKFRGESPQTECDDWSKNPEKLRFDMRGGGRSISEIERRLRE